MGKTIWLDSHNSSKKIIAFEEEIGEFWNYSHSSRILLVFSKLNPAENDTNEEVHI